MCASPHPKRFFLDLYLSVHQIGNKYLFIKKGILVMENRFRQVIRQFPACVSFIGIGDTSLGDADCRLLFRFQTDDHEINTIESFLRTLLSVLPSTVLYGRLSCEEQCVGGWLFADRANAEPLRVENQPTTTPFDDSEDEDDPRPQFMSSEPVSRNAPPEGLSRLYNGHDIFSDAFHYQRDTAACMKLDQLHDCQIVHLGRVCGGERLFDLLCKPYQDGGQLNVGDIAVIGYDQKLARRIRGLQEFKSDNTLDLRF